MNDTKPTNSEVVYASYESEKLRFCKEDRRDLMIHYVDFLSDAIHADGDEKSKKYYAELEKISPQESFCVYFDALKSIDLNKDELIRFAYNCNREIHFIEDSRAFEDFYQQIKGIMRIIPFIEKSCGEYSRSYFIDIHEKSVGIIIFGNGTLNIKFKKGNIAEFTHAKKTAYGGMVSSDGRVKITKYLGNSSYIRNFLELVR